MLKIGDRLLCKRDTDYLGKVKDKYYTITDIADNKVYFSDIGNIKVYFFDDDDDFYIWKYFYTPQEVRKLKLEKLNDVKSR